MDGNGFEKGGKRILFRIQRKICYIMMCILLLTGIYGTYVKADNVARQAASLEAASFYMIDQQVTETERLSKSQQNLTEISVCVVERINPMIRTVISRLAVRNNVVRRDIRFLSFLFWAFCVIYFLFRCGHIEECLCLHEKTYRTALIKYIHDLDGKKRVACLL